MLSTMNEDLQNEVEAINSIYGDGTLTLAEDSHIYILILPQHSTSLRIQFPLDYPAAPPLVLGSESSGQDTRKGEAAQIVGIFRGAISTLFQPGEVCLFDVIEEVNSALDGQQDVESEPSGGIETQLLPADPLASNEPVEGTHEPPWTLSDVVVEMKSVFVARAAPVSSPDEAKKYLQHLLDNDKKVRSASHNITAWRIRGDNGVAYQDCDDDGETAAGGRVLHLMQLMDIWNAMVVVTRWYGGHQLGPKRFSIINVVARDSFVKGNFVLEDSTVKKKGKR